jgi:hypothetical protein
VADPAEMNAHAFLLRLKPTTLPVNGGAPRSLLLRALFIEPNSRCSEPW